jgi:hypothetical protein
MRKSLLLTGAAAALSIAALFAFNSSVFARGPGGGPGFAAGHAFAAVPPVVPN